MTIDEDVVNFIKWATNLGFPLEELPNEDALKSIFKSRQRDLFNGLIEKIQPCAEADKIQKNILLHKMSKVKDQMVQASCTRNFLPKEMQRYLKMEDLKKKKLKLESHVEEYKNEYEALANSIKIKNMQMIKIEHKFNNLEAKTNVLDLKKESLEKDLENEKEIKDKIISTMPVKVRVTNVNESNATKLVLEALKELEEFYNVCLNTSNPHMVQDAKDDMWRKLRETFRSIPNFLIFNNILKLKEEQLQNIISLNKTSLDSGNVSIPSNANVGAFNKNMLRAKASIPGIVASGLAAQRERENMNRKFSSVYTQFVNAVQCKVNLFNTEGGEDVEEIISDYIVQYNTRSFNKGQNDFLAGEIEKCKAQIEIQSKALEDHNVLLGSIKQMYSDIDATVNRIQYETMQLNQVKEKILYSKSVLQHVIGDATSNQHKFASTKVKNNSGGDIFDVTDNVFSSTKVDFDSSMNNTMMRGDLTFMPQVRNFLVPFAGEISMFMETPMDRLNNVIKENIFCAYYLLPNPLIIEAQELSSTIQLAPGLLLTAEGVFDEVLNNSQWVEKITEMSAPLSLSTEIIPVDSTDFRRKIKQQHEQITEILDRIDVVGINTNRTLKKVANYYNFVLHNPLRHYIPQSKLFNNQAYAEYEAEYMMYYRMATVGGSVK